CNVCRRRCCCYPHLIAEKLEDWGCLSNLPKSQQLVIGKARIPVQVWISTLEKTKLNGEQSLVRTKRGHHLMSSSYAVGHMCRSLHIGWHSEHSSENRSQRANGYIGQYGEAM
ncbi:hypothetical protein H1C71_012596, partial [Ictidomys tridecemlineatus]